MLLSASAADGARAGQPVDVASSAYAYRSDRAAELNPPEAWILLMQYANQPFEKPADTAAPAVRKALCGLLWEEVRPIDRHQRERPGGRARASPW